MPDKDEAIDWASLIAFAHVQCGIPAKDFWTMTWAEFWPVLNVKLGKLTKPMTKRDYDKLNEAWINGNFRRDSSTTDGGSKRP